MRENGPNSVSVCVQGRGGDLCGVQSHADRGGAPRAAAHVRGVGL